MQKTKYPVVAAGLALLAYATYRVIEGQVNGFTALLAFLALACLGVLAAETAMNRLGIPGTMRRNVRLVIGVTLAFLLGAEAVLRLGGSRFGINPNSNRRSSRSPYQVEQGRLHVYRPGQMFELQMPEFVHRRRSNSLGLADEELKEEKAPGEYRIVALGDNYTEGVGAGEDETWVRVMQRILAARYPDKKVTALNAGVSGADPFDEFILLQEKLLPLKPDLVILMINNADINEVMIRGGRERYRPDGTPQYRRGPVWEPVYGMSYVFRIFVHKVLGYNFLLLSRSQMQEEIRTGVRTMRTGLSDFQRLCQSEGIDLLIAVHPTKFEIQVGAADSVYSTMLRGLSQNSHFKFVDLLKDFKEEGSLTKDNIDQYFWARDLHLNPDGYKLMGTAMARHVVDTGFVEQRSMASR